MIKQRAKRDITIVKQVMVRLAISRHNGQMPPNQLRHCVTVPDADIYSTRLLTLASNDVNTPGLTASSLTLTD